MARRKDEAPADNAEKQRGKQHKAPHLKPYEFQPGQSGNPGGRPKGAVSFTALAHRLMAKDDGALAEAIIERCAKEAKAGKFVFLKELWDRLDGPIATKLQLQGEVELLLATAKRVLPTEYYDALVDALAAEPGQGGAGGAT